MTDLTTMPENYENIRSGIVELLKAPDLPLPEMSIRS